MTSCIFIFIKDILLFSFFFLKAQNKIINKNQVSSFHLITKPNKKLTLGNLIPPFDYRVLNFLRTFDFIPLQGPRTIFASWHTIAFVFRARVQFSLDATVLAKQFINIHIKICVRLLQSRCGKMVFRSTALGLKPLHLITTTEWRPNKHRKKSIDTIPLMREEQV